MLIGACFIVFVFTSLVWTAVYLTFGRKSTTKYQEYDQRVSQQLELNRIQKEELIQQRKEIAEKTKALRKLFHHIHHDGPRKAMSSQLGLVNLYWQESKELRENLELLRKPDHHRYADLALHIVGKMDDMIRKAETIARHLHSSSTDDVSDYEHLQE